MGTINFSGVVLNGGQSSRMGEPKGEMQFLGRRLMEGPIEALRESGASELIVVGGERPYWVGNGVSHVPDRYPGDGPLGGVITALDVAGEENIVVLANDLMNIDQLTIRKILAHVNAPHTVVPVVEGHRQVLAALWHSSVLPALCEVYGSGIRSLQSALQQIDVIEICDLDGNRFVNANTPSDIIDYIATLGEPIE